jgi:hypothetical protein
VAFVGYRDYDDEKRIERLDFTEDTSAVINFMNNVEAVGGGDTCEDVFGGLDVVRNLTWSSPNRVLIHVADAPPHGSR